jgi:hypothetical protein
VNALAKYDAMCRAIDAAYEVDEVKDIRDKSIALEHYARQAKNIEAERQACEIPACAPSARPASCSQRPSRRVAIKNQSRPTRLRF